jgi:putative FmdB family regulatory protein
MPIYEYQCEACGHQLEALQKYNDPPLKKCPDCAKPRLRRLLSAPMFLLKGSGWYETDFKSDKENRKNLADRPDKEKEEKPEAKPDKPEAAAPAAKAEKKDESKAESGTAATPAKRSAVKARRSHRTKRPPHSKRR